MTTQIQADGSRVVCFYVTQRLTGRELKSVTFRPVQFDHLLRWKDGLIPSSMALLCDLTGLTELELRQITFPDAERLTVEFLNHIPTGIRDDIESGKKPMPSGEQQEAYYPEHAPQPPEPPRAPPPAAPPGDPTFSQAQAEAIALAGGDPEDGPGFEEDR